jgi:hypothetical protein
VTEPIEAAAPGRSRTLPLLLGIVALLLLGFLLLKVLGGGGGDSDQGLSTTTTVRRPLVTTTTTVAPAPTESFEVFGNKNPFLPLRGSVTGGTTTAATGSGVSSTSITRSGTSTGSGTGTLSGTGSGSGTASTGGTTGTSSGGNQPAAASRVSMVDMFSDGGKVVANVKVNDTVYKVTAGQTFATNFKVISLSQAQGCGQFLFGDDQFRLCKGEQVLK